MKLYATILGCVAALAFIIAGALRINHWREQSALVPSLKRDLATVSQNFIAYRRDNEAEQIRLKGIHESLAAEMDQLRVRARVPDPVIRLCDAPAAGNSVPPAVTPAAGNDATPAGTGQSGNQNTSNPGAVLGTELIRFAREDDAMIARFRALQSWAATLPKCEPVTP